MKRSKSTKWSNIVHYLKDFYSHELPNYSSILFFSGLVLLSVIILYFFDRSDAKFDWHDILVEAHGLVFDLIVFGVVITIFEYFRNRRENIKRYQENIQDYSGWQSDEAKHLIVSNINRLHDLGIRTFYLSESYLKGANLGDFDMSGSVMAFCNLENASFVRSNLNSVNLVAANLSNVYFTNTCLQNADLRNSNCKGTHFTVTDLRGCNFTHADLRNAVCIACDWKEAILTNANVENMIVDDINWMDELHRLSIAGADEIALRYFVDPKSKKEVDGYFQYKIKPRRIKRKSA